MQTQLFLAISEYQTNSFLYLILFKFSIQIHREGHFDGTQRQEMDFIRMAIRTLYRHRM